MKRLVITGANGVGKSHLAARLAKARPEVPVISFDALKLQTGWAHRPRAQIDENLERALEQDAWILEGGPSMLQRALPKAQGLVWVDPPERVRAWRLARRPWTSFGRTRPELPEGNVDWPWQQYRFALRSLSKRAAFQTYLSDAYAQTTEIAKWRCQTPKDLERVIAAWAAES